MTDVVAILPDIREEMEAMRLQLRILSACSWQSGKPLYKSMHQGSKFQNRAPMVGCAMRRKLRTSCLTWKNTFIAANIEDETRRVTTTTMYLGRDAKLWWRTKCADIQANMA
ncbi:Uncharacterized protein Adt_05359 [Abeliophyllum distichum]|uniref:Uncharacterized protein n=1 Tax=Abeliophyllum distichum TaxID=126358 RepID=A0ABD1V5Z2_9LAMI